MQNNAKKEKAHSENACGLFVCEYHYQSCSRVYCVR